MRFFISLFILSTTTLFAAPPKLNTEPNPARHEKPSALRKDSKALVGPLETRIIATIIDGRESYTHITGEKEGRKTLQSDRRKIAEMMVDYPCIREARTRLADFLASDEAWNLVPHDKNGNPEKPLSVSITFTMLNPNATKAQACQDRAEVTFRTDIPERFVSGRKLVKGMGVSTLTIPITQSTKADNGFDYVSAFTAGVLASQKNAVNDWAVETQKAHDLKRRHAAVSDIIENDLK